MSQFLADREAGLPVYLALLGRQILGRRSTGCRCLPSCEFLVAVLGVLMSMTSGYLPRLNRSRKTSSAIPQMKETILLWVAWSTVGLAPLFFLTGRRQGVADGQATVTLPDTG